MPCIDRYAEQVFNDTHELLVVFGSAGTGFAEQAGTQGTLFFGGPVNIDAAMGTETTDRAAVGAIDPNGSAITQNLVSIRFGL
jgi:hypothetical protein